MSVSHRGRLLALNLALSAGVTALALGAAEGVCRWIEPPPADTRRQNVQQWKEERPGEHFYTMSTENHGWPPWQEFNRDGLRDRRHPVEKTPGTRRLMFLGDSVTAAIGLAPEEAFPRLLEADYRREGLPVEVFSVALWGWSTRQHRIAYRRIGRKYRPDEVVLAVCLNDIQELEHQLARPPAVLVALHQRSALVRRVVGAHRRERQDVEALVLGRRGYEHLFEEVRALRDEVRADGAAFKLLVFPYRFQYEPGAPPPAAQEAIGGFCREAGVPFLDLLPELRALGASAFIDENHLSTAGSRRVADVLQTGTFLERITAHAAILGDTPPQRAITSARAEERRAAAWALGRAKSTPDVVRALATAVTDADTGVVVEATRSLALHGPAAAAARGTLLGLAAHPREDVRAEAARAAWSLGLTGDDGPAVLAHLGSEDEYIRHFAVWASGQIGAGGASAVPTLLAMIDTEDVHGGGTATASLRRLAIRDPSIVQTVAADLTAAEPDRRARAARNLGRLGTAAAPASSGLLAALRDEHENVRAEAVIALGRTETAAAVGPLVERLRSDTGWVREEAARALGRIGLPAAPAIPDLMHALRRDDPPVRRQSARALGRVGPEAAMARPALEEALTDRVEAVREEAQRALDALGAAKP